MLAFRFFSAVILATCASFGVRTANAKTIVVPFFDPRIQYDAAWSLSREQGPYGPQGICVDSSSQSADASSLGASFSFTFNGTDVRLVTSSGPGVAAYDVMRDNTAVVSVQPALFAADTCTVTFASTSLAIGMHTIHVALAGSSSNTQLRVLGIIYDDSNSNNSSPTGSSAQTPKTLSTGATVAILACAVVGILAVLAPLVWLFCMKRRARRPNSHPPRRLELREKALGVLSSTPTFLKHSRTKYFKTYIRLESDELPKTVSSSSDMKSSNSLSVLSMLKPPVPAKRGQTSTPRPLQPAAVRHGRMQSLSYFVHNKDPTVTHSST